MTVLQSPGKDPQSQLWDGAHWEETSVECCSSHPACRRLSLLTPIYLKLEFGAQGQFHLKMRHWDRPINVHGVAVSTEYFVCVLRNKAVSVVSPCWWWRRSQKRKSDPETQIQFQTTTSSQRDPRWFDCHTGMEHIKDPCRLLNMNLQLHELALVY